MKGLDIESTCNATHAPEALLVCEELILSRIARAVHVADEEIIIFVQEFDS